MAGIENPSLLLQVSQRNAFPGSERVRVWQGQDETILTYRLEGEKLLLGHRRVHKPEIDPVPRQCFSLLRSGHYKG